MSCSLIKNYILQERRKILIEVSLSKLRVSTKVYVIKSEFYMKNKINVRGWSEYNDYLKKCFGKINVEVDLSKTIDNTQKLFLAKLMLYSRTEFLFPKVIFIKNNQFLIAIMKNNYWHRVSPVKFDIA